MDNVRSNDSIASSHSLVQHPYENRLAEYH